MPQLPSNGENGKNWRNQDPYRNNTKSLDEEEKQQRIPGHPSDENIKHTEVKKKLEVWIYWDREEDLKVQTLE